MGDPAPDGPLRLHCYWYHRTRGLFSPRIKDHVSCHFEIPGLSLLSLHRLAFNLWALYCDSFSYHQELYIASTIHPSMSQIVLSHNIEDIYLATLTIRILSMVALTYKSRPELTNPLATDSRL